MDGAHGFQEGKIGSDEEEGSLPRGKVNREIPGKSKDQRMPSRLKHLFHYPKTKK